MLSAGAGSVAVVLMLLLICCARARVCVCLCACVCVHSPLCLPVPTRWLHSNQITELAKGVFDQNTKLESL